MIGLVPGQIVTEALVEELRAEDGLALADPERDLAKIAVIERHLGTGRIGLGFVRGFGLRRGAFASTFSHDAHNLVVVGVDDDDMARAVERLVELGGGLVVVDGGAVTAELPLPVAGLVSDLPLADVIEASEATVAAVHALGSEVASPFQSLAFLALSVIPSLKITDHGLVDVDRFELVPLAADVASHRGLRACVSETQGDLRFVSGSSLVFRNTKSLADGDLLHHLRRVQRAEEAVGAGLREAVREDARLRPRRREALRAADDGHVVLERAHEPPREGRAALRARPARSP